MRGHREIILVLILFLMPIFLPGCGRRPDLPESSSSKEQKLPFDRASRAGGISPSQSIVPAAALLPEGKSIGVHLRANLSSASARVGDTFDGVVDEPVVNDEQTLVPRGAAVIVRVLAARRSDARESGYLRIALVSVEVGGKTVLLDTSSIFAKGGSRAGGAPRDVIFTPERRLIFHVTESVDLP